MRTIWFPFYLDDYDADTQHLSLAEHGVYLVLMKHYYRTGKPLLANAKQLQIICRAKKSELCVIESVLQHFFVLVNGEYHHSRIDRELARINKLSKIRAKSASSKCRAIAEHLSTESESESQSDIKQDLKSKSVTPAKNQATRLPEHFTPSEDHYAISKELGINCEMEFQKFRDYFLGVSGQKAFKRDWPATFRNWLRNSSNFSGRGGGNAGQQLTKTQQRFVNNARVAMADLGHGDFIEGRSAFGQGTDARGDEIVVPVAARALGKGN